MWRRGVLGPKKERISYPDFEYGLRHVLCSKLHRISGQSSNGPQNLGVLLWASRRQGALKREGVQKSSQHGSHVVEFS